ncbi:hypothetical protein BC829DRAFT_488769 [Chytridium lagenaria]|nr:hypothetical protein BC829DRAFT_488769 [Chytridium lagenaria]
MDDIFKVLKDRMATKSADRKLKIAAEYERVNAKIQEMAVSHVSGFQKSFEACVAQHKSTIQELIAEREAILLKLQAEHEKMNVSITPHPLHLNSTQLTRSSSVHSIQQKVQDDFLTETSKIDKARKKLQDQIGVDLKVCYSDLRKVLDPHLMDPNDSSNALVLIAPPSSRAARRAEWGRGKQSPSGTLLISRRRATSSVEGIGGDDDEEIKRPGKKFKEDAASALERILASSMI